MFKTVWETFFIPSGYYFSIWKILHLIKTMSLSSEQKRHEAGSDVFTADKSF